MTAFPEIPAADTPLRADWGRKVVACLRALQVRAGNGILVAEGPDGSQLSLASSSRRREGVVAEPFDLSFAGAVATLKNCVYARGSVTVALDDLTHTVGGADGEIWLALKLNAETGAAEIIEGASVASVTDASVVPDSAEVKRLLYKIRKATVSSSVCCTVLADYRRQPVLGLYV